MSQIFSREIGSTLQGLIQEFANPDYQGWQIEAWVFADAPSRRTAAEKLQQHGVNACIYSAYKPLLHFFLEDLPADNAEINTIKVGYPRHQQACDKRFLLEAYPLTALVGSADIAYEPHDQDELYYQVEITLTSGEQQQYPVFAPNRIHRDQIRDTHLSPTGWLKVANAQGVLFRNEHLATDYEQLFHSTMQAITQHDWGDKAPYFDELNICVELPYIDQKLTYGHESISLSEALHEDFYLSLQEWFNVKAGRQADDRSGQSGQIVPEIRTGEAFSVRVETRTFSLTGLASQYSALPVAEAPISLGQAQTELSLIPGEVFTAHSRAGRAIEGRYHTGRDAAVMISGGQHANETSGVIGSLRAALALASKPDSHFTICPIENPDGYALHQRLITDNPCHMHHAARYTALGDDLEYRYQAVLFEKEIRYKAQALSQAQLHINLHGYPSHEWTRPLSGYVPQGFAMWTLPKGFFLILRYREDWSARAELLLDKITRKLADIPDLLDFNRSQIELYQIHAGESGFRMINGFPCLVSLSQPGEVPLQLITEYPDETIYGEHFVKGHTVQTFTTLIAYDAYQELMQNSN